MVSSFSDKSRFLLLVCFNSVINISRRKSKTDPVAISGGRGGKFGSCLLLFLFVVRSCRASAVLGNLHLDKTAGKLYSLNHVAVFRWALEEVKPEIE